MNFETVKIADLISEIAMGPFGSNIKVECFVDEGIPVLNGSNLNGYALHEGSFRYVTEEKADSLGRANAHRGDVVITHRGTLGQIVFIPEDSLHERYVISQSQFRVKCNEKILPEYLVYYFHTRIGQHKLLSNASQVGVPALARASTTFQTIEIDIPDMESQKKIVDLIETIRSKVEVNSEINENLSDQIQAIYSNEFDPTTHTPSGVLADICTYSSDKIPVSELSVSTYYSTENMQPNKMGSVDATSLPSITQTTGCHKGDVLISNIRPYFKKIVYVTDDSCGCSTDVLCFVPKEDQYSAFLFGTLYMDRFFDYMVAGSKGTKMPRGDKQQIMNYPVVLPDKESLDVFNGLIAPMLDQIATNRAESDRLAALRDALLPKLMSGELDLSSTDL